MKVCDKCGEPDGKLTSNSWWSQTKIKVGHVNIDYCGYHYKHWTHNGKKERWECDLCEGCLRQLVLELDAAMRKFTLIPRAVELGASVEFRDESVRQVWHQE